MTAPVEPTSWTWWAKLAGLVLLVVALNIAAWRIGSKAQPPSDEGPQ